MFTPKKQFNRTLLNPLTYLTSPFMVEVSIIYVYICLVFDIEVILLFMFIIEIRV